MGRRLQDSVRELIAVRLLTPHETEFAEICSCEHPPRKSRLTATKKGEPRLPPSVRSIDKPVRLWAYFQIGKSIKHGLDVKNILSIALIDYACEVVRKCAVKPERQRPRIMGYLTLRSQPGVVAIE